MDGLTLYLKAGPALDFETNPNLDVTVNVVDATVAGSTPVTTNVSIAITDANDAPTVASAIADQSASEDTAFSFQFASDVFADVDVGDTLTYTAQVAGGGELPDWLQFDSDTRTFSGTPENGDVGAITVKVTATDTAYASVSDTFDITVANANDAPTAAAGSTSTDEDTPIVAASLPVATDDDGDPVAYVLGATSASHGAVTVHADGTFDYAPAADFNGADAFSYVVSDGNGGSNAVTITPMNDAPTVAILRHNRLQHAIPTVSAVNIAGSQGASFQIAKLIEQEQWMIAAAGVMPVPDAVFLFAMGGTDA